MRQIVSFEDKIDVGSELNALARRHRQQSVVIQDGIESFNPFGIDIAVADDPRCRIYILNHRQVKMSVILGQNLSKIYQHKG